MSSERAVSENTVRDLAQEQFLENLRWAQDVVASWTPEEKIYNSIGYPSVCVSDEIAVNEERDSECDG